MKPMTNSETPPTEASVYERYAAAANAVEPALCCPVQYSAELLDIIPDEIIQKDYGCGDPTPLVRSGETVLDLGSGGGKLCYIAAQVVGPTGHVIGVDCNCEMLRLARKHALVYRGPFKKVEDDDGHAYRRGERIAVCDKTFQLLQSDPYSGLFDAIESRVEVPLEDARPFDCRRNARRDPSETKGREYHATTDRPADGCGGDECC